MYISLDIANILQHKINQKFTFLNYQVSPINNTLPYWFYESVEPM